MRHLPLVLSSVLTLAVGLLISLFQAATQLPLDLTLVGHGRAAQRAPAHEHRHAADAVVHELVPIEDAERVGSGLSADGHPADLLVRFEPTLAELLQLLAGWMLAGRRLDIALFHQTSSIRSASQHVILTGKWQANPKPFSSREFDTPALWYCNTEVQIVHVLLRQTCFAGRRPY